MLGRVEGKDQTKSEPNTYHHQPHQHSRILVAEELTVKQQHALVLSEDFSASGTLADDDTRGIQIVVKCAAFPQKFWRENEVFGSLRLIKPTAEDDTPN